MAQAPLYFIQPHVVERLITGQFVPKRQQNKAYKMRDRRDMLSALNVTRRSIRYEPLVFSNRKNLIIQAIENLNNPQKKVLLISGPEGRGKTAFIRAIVEMMGGGKEQLLWFDVSRHTDFDEIIRFLVEYLIYTVQPENTALPKGENPIATLEMLLRQAYDLPLLLVVDNIEYLVTPEQAIRSQELKNAFNFLLGFANVKLILSGTKLPFSDIPVADPTTHIGLPSLTPEESESLAHAWSPQYQNQQTNLAFATPFYGEPYLLEAFAKLYEAHPDPQIWLELFKNQAFSRDCASILLHILDRYLSPEEKQILEIFSVIRHGLPPSGFRLLMEMSAPALASYPFQHLDNQLGAILLKKVYPPQLVLDKLRYRDKGRENPDIQAYYQMYDVFQSIYRAGLSENQRKFYHQALQKFYTAERNKHILQRVYPARTRHLLAEAQFHQQQLKRRRQMNTSPASEVIKSQAMPIKGQEMLPESQIAPHSNPNLPDNLLEEQEAALSSEALIQKLKQDFGVSEPPLATNSSSPGYAGQSSQAVPIPISIQVEPVAMAKGGLRLTEEDLEKLATLLIQSAGRLTGYNRGQSFDASISSSSEDEMSLQTVRNEISSITSILSEDAVEPDERPFYEALEAAMMSHDKSKVAQVLFDLGRLRLEKDLNHYGESCLLKALEFATDVRADAMAASIQIHLGHFYLNCYQHNKASKMLRKAVHFYESQSSASKSDRVNLMMAYQDMAEIDLYRHDYGAAIALYEKCLSLSQSDLSQEAGIRFKMGLAYDEAQNVPAAIRAYQESFQASQRFQDDQGCAAALYNLASLLYESDKMSGALSTLDQCLIYDRRIDNPNDLSRSYLLRSKISESSNRFDDALESAEQAYHIVQGSNPRQNLQMASVCIRLGDLCDKLNRWKQAATYYEEAQYIAADELSEESRLRIQHRLKWISERLA